MIIWQINGQVNNTGEGLNVNQRYFIQLIVQVKFVFPLKAIADLNKRNGVMISFP